MRPLMEQGQKVEEEIHQLFAALLAKGRLNRKDQGLIKKLYYELQRRGTLSPAPDAVDDDHLFDCPDDEPEPCPCGVHHPPPGSPDSAAAAKRTAPKGTSSLRDIFRRLAVAIHPDRSQSDADRDYRTEAMKEITRAYQDGDLARLLELEKAWLAAEETPVDGRGETERRCSSLERTNRELKKQLRTLENELRELKHSVPVLAADELGLLGKGSAARVESLISEMQDSLNGIQRVRDFVRSFVDGKIAIDEFLMGPDGGMDSADVDLDLEDVDAFFADMFLRVEHTSRGRRGRRPRRSSVPF
jgi:hypothetical protein